MEYVCYGWRYVGKFRLSPLLSTDHEDTGQSVIKMQYVVHATLTDRTSLYSRDRQFLSQEFPYGPHNVRDVLFPTSSPLFDLDIIDVCIARMMEGKPVEMPLFSLDALVALFTHSEEPN